MLEIAASNMFQDITTELTEAEQRLARVLWLGTILIEVSIADEDVAVAGDYFRNSVFVAGHRNGYLPAGKRDENFPSLVMIHSYFK